MAHIGNLYSKNILVRVTNSKSEDKFKSIHITVDYQTSIQPTHKTELIIKLTDEMDPFFLYSLYMSEEDYQTLKIQQGLLVDFSAFGQRFIDLLFACEKDEKSENPKFQLQFYSKEPLSFDHGHASLNVIEINPFKHLCHLSLNFLPGNDSDVKKYLATCLQTTRDDYTKLNRLYEETKQSLNQKLESTQQMLCQKSIEVDKLKVELDSQSERIITKHMQELNFERDKSMQNQYASQQKWDKEKKEIELNHMKAVKQFETRLAELELNNKDLLEKKYKNEAQLQEFRLKNTSLQEEYNGLKQELNNIRKQNSSMDSELHSNEKLTNQLRTKIAVLEQELKDKLDMLNKVQDLFTNEQSQRKLLDETLKEKTNELKKKQAEINHYIQEFKKGNEVVIKLQTREKTLAAQIKLKTKILNEQEKVMKEKEKEIDDLKSEMRESKSQMNTLNDENKDLKNSLQKKTAELDEAAKLLKRDESIITWLNKQVNDNNIAMNGKQLSYESTNTVMFKPMGALNSNFSPLSSSNQIDSILNGNSLNMVRSSQSSNGLGSNNMNQFMNKPNDMDSGGNRRLLISNGSQMPMYSNGGNYHQTRALSSSSSSSIQQAETLKENQEIESPTLSHRTLNTNCTTNTNGSTRLDPKYFQSHSSAISSSLDMASSSKQLMNNVNKSNTNGNMFPSSNTNNSRINKQFAQPTSQLSSASAQFNSISAPSNPIKSTPSLASAYFPAN